jgi:S1-C subfamily serine protease
LKLARFLAALWLCGYVATVAPQTRQSPQPAEEPAEAKPEAVAPAESQAEEPSPDEPAPEEGTPDENAVDAAAVEADIAAQELSDDAQVRLDAARASVVQIRAFYHDSNSSAFHGSGFAVDDGRRIITNYHVVAQAVLYPRQYRLEYLADDGRTGRLHVLAIDVRNDLAVVAADDLELPPLRLRLEIPAQGERAWSIGFPLNLGLTITEGVANGLVESSIEQRIHYTGAINGGMSGGPALDRRGRVYGVNVSVVTGRQLVGFVVPAMHLPALLARAKQPLDQVMSAQQLRQRVTAQVLAYEAQVIEAQPEEPGTQKVRGYVLPTQISRYVECSTVDERSPHVRVRVEAVSCRIPSRILAQPGVYVAGLSMQHRILQSVGLHPLQFERQVNELAESQLRTGASAHVAPFACRDALVSLDGFDARISTCVRQYRLFAGLYDFDVTVVGIDDASEALVSRLALQGVAFESGKRTMERYLGALQWTP